MPQVELSVRLPAQCARAARCGLYILHASRRGILLVWSGLMYLEPPVLLGRGGATRRVSFILAGLGCLHFEFSLNSRGAK